MIDLYVYDGNLNQIGIIDGYQSLIWAKRYNAVGDCEVVVDPTAANLDLLKIDYYIGRHDDDMTCIIKKIEIDTNADGKNQLIVTGKDVKGILDQRIIWNTTYANNLNLEVFIRRLVWYSCGSAANADRRMKKKDNATDLIGFLDKMETSVVCTEQVSYKNVGEKIREYCNTYQWGYKMVRDGEILKFGLFRGTDKSDDVMFCPQFDNLSTSKYILDYTKGWNVALVGGEGEGVNRKMQTFGTAIGMTRYEVFVDAKDKVQTTTWKEFDEQYPNGWFETVSQNLYRYRLTTDILIMDDAHLAWLEETFENGSVVTVSGVEYYRIPDCFIATMNTSNPVDNTVVTLQPVIYNSYLLQRGSEKVAGFGKKETFTGTAIPNVTFVYKQDFDLGDVVTVKNEFGISAKARITEILENVDKSGQKTEIKYVYLGG